MALASSGRPSANGVPCISVVVVASECCSVGKWGGARTPRRLGISLASGNEVVAVTVGLETEGWRPDPTSLLNMFEKVIVTVTVRLAIIIETPF